MRKSGVKTLTTYNAYTYMRNNHIHPDDLSDEHIMALWKHELELEQEGPKVDFDSYPAVTAQCYAQWAENNIMDESWYNTT